ncbi:low affinity immunoglobulin gamma Fc region receptor II-c-like isoform X2 [Epinephelus moara]|uniref:low affinity immunoglobulin gamma Fc region receptor II-c-like isoform X2 n=1 Tax=Epinephelus moara TaxID=300413 RepID=UPI00214E1D62|nr:low affinity immunoglobulin gamma Fc region receptor II-c-like isoform X2 [Epinephelus moara]
MEVTALCFRLLMLEVTLLNSFTQKSDAAFLRITPDRLQHFQYEPVSFECEESDGSTKLKVIRNNVESDRVCDTERTPSGSSCTIEGAYPSDSGEYWCEAEGGERSNSVNISVITADSVILESPALPVTEGNNVTLRCRKKNTSNLRADFYKDGLHINTSSTGNMTINNVSKSDEGLYKCHISGAGGSPESWMAVGDSVICSVTAHTVSVTPPSPHQEPHSDDAGAPHVLILLWMSVTILMLALVLVVVGFLQIRKHRVSSKKPDAALSSVCEEDAADDPNGVTYAIVVTKPREGTDAADAADNLSLKSNHSRKPRTGEDEDESSFQPVYSALTISETPQAPQQEPGSSSKETPSPTAAKDSSSTEQELLYAPVRKMDDKIKVCWTQMP